MLPKVAAMLLRAFAFLFLAHGQLNCIRLGAVIAPAYAAAPYHAAERPLVCWLCLSSKRSELAGADGQILQYGWPPLKTKTKKRTEKKYLTDDSAVALLFDLSRMAALHSTRRKLIVYTYVHFQYCPVCNDDSTTYF
jgi:hypothetical protein